MEKKTACNLWEFIYGSMHGIRNVGEMYIHKFKMYF